MALSDAEPAKAKAKPKAKPAAAKESAAPEEMPWTLRDHFGFTLEKSTINYAVEDAEWQLTVDGLGLVIDKVGFKITFADGSTLDNFALGKGVSNREPFSNDTGKGTVYTSEFPAKDGLVVHHGFTIYSDRPFALLRLELGNTGTKPIEIAKVAPMVIGAGHVSLLSADTNVSTRRMTLRGAHPVFDKTTPPLFTVLNDAAHNLSLAFGMIPQGIASSSVELLPGGGSWQGEAVCAYAPAIRIDPGQKLAADPLFVTINVPIPARIDQYFSWMLSQPPHPKPAGEIPRCWVTAEKGTSETEFLKTVRDWAGANVKHALVPENWEGRPGSLEGKTPDYPKDMGKAADKIAGLGMTPGVTVDPLLTSGGTSDWAVASSDGATWLNLSVPEARARAAERLKKMAASGFKFFVVQPSGIPDEILKQFNMTRVQADGLAVMTLQEAMGASLVLPSSGAPLKAELDPWLEAASVSSRLAEFGVMPGPVRLDVGGATGLDATLLAALTFSSGPIELVGKPAPGVEKQIAELMTRPRCYARPLDIAKQCPKAWHLSLAGVEDGHRGDSVVVFPGAGTWSLGDLLAESKDEPMVWKQADGTVVELKDGAVPAVDAFAVYGVTPKIAHPILMGASSGLGLMLNDLINLNWKEDTSVLSGAFAGGNRARATAYVLVPEGWSLKSGKAGDTAIKKGTGARIEFPVEAGKQTRFQFEFVRP